ncbi:hypothetical protein B7P43_G08583 [Cryptotermes secundus]|uniref:Integrase catalytic domain-containing protein n=1 Tax=Cryptotermes secundus TaxID=105785 RepID=A0A2J7PCE1_9NEOP|nr:hypothetical protein B7P43_G08583 [Cryptotermes secundus]
MGKYLFDNNRKLDVTACSSVVSILWIRTCCTWSGAKLIKHSNNFMFTLPVDWFSPRHYSYDSWRQVGVGQSHLVKRMIRGLGAEIPQLIWGLMHQYNIKAPLERIAADMVGLFPQSDQGNRQEYLVIGMDYFTKWPDAYSTLEKDQGRNFESGLMQVLQHLGVSKMPAVGRHG